MNGSIRQRSKGSWQVRYRAQGEYHSETVKGTKGDAKRRLRELLVAVDRGLGTPSKDSLAAWLDKWLAEHIRPSRSLGTWERYEINIRKHISPAIGHLKLKDVTPEVIHDFQRGLTEKGLQASAQKLVRAVLSGALKLAVRYGLLHFNPVERVEAPSLPKKEVEIPSRDDVLAVLEAGRTSGDWLFPAIHLLAASGMRPAEALGLRWEDVDLAAGVIYIHNQIVYSRSRHGLVDAAPKTESGKRFVEIDDDTLAVLSNHWDAQHDVKRTMEDSYQDTRVFACADGSAVSGRRLHLAINRLSALAGVEHLSPKSFRHFHASLMLAGGQNVVDVSKRLGHSKTSITLDVYSHLMPGQGRKLADAFAQLMDAPR